MFGIAYNLEQCLFVHDHIPPGYHKHMDRQRQKTISGTDEPRILKQARTELTALRGMFYEGRSERPPVPSEGADGGKSLS